MYDMAGLSRRKKKVQYCLYRVRGVKKILEIIGVFDLNSMYASYDDQTLGR